MNRRSLIQLSALALTVGLTACDTRSQSGEPAQSGAKAPQTVATATLIDSAGREVGTATFTNGANPALSVKVSGLTPGAHGIHIHEQGTCTPPKFESAGGHLNPTGKHHGLMNPEGPHAGDLPNLMVRPDSVADTTFTIAAALLESGEGSLFRPNGTALVIHADADDERTDPSGNSGSRIACGPIERHTM